MTITKEEMILYMIKFDGDEVPSHPYTVVRTELLKDNPFAVFKVTGAIQMVSIESATRLVRMLQRNEMTWPKDELSHNMISLGME